MIQGPNPGLPPVVVKSLCRLRGVPNFLKKSLKCIHQITHQNMKIVDRIVLPATGVVRGGSQVAELATFLPSAVALAGANLALKYDWAGSSARLLLRNQKRACQQGQH